jgi:hypothetical protein
LIYEKGFLVGLFALLGMTEERHGSKYSSKRVACGE